MLRYLPQSLGGLIGGPLTTILLRRVSTQIVFMLGCVCCMAGSLVFALSHDTDTYWDYAQFFAFFLSIMGASSAFHYFAWFILTVVELTRPRFHSHLRERPYL